MSAIASEDPVNITDLARRLGITKGAVSQMATRLERKGLVVRSRSADNDKEVFLGLTRKGERANGGHVKFHGKMYRDFTGMMRKITPEQASQFKEVMDRIEFHLGSYE